MGDTPYRESVSRVRRKRQDALGQLAVLERLAEAEGLRLILHPRLAVLIEPSTYSVAANDEDGAFLREALEADGALVVGCAVQIPSGRAAGYSFPRSMLPLKLTGHPYAVVRYWSYDNTSIDVVGGRCMELGNLTVESGEIRPSRLGETPAVEFSSISDAWGTYEKEQAAAEELRRTYGAQLEERRRLDAFEAARKAERDREAWEQTMRADREKRDREREALWREYGVGLCRVRTRGVTETVELRQSDDGTVHLYTWANDAAAIGVDEPLHHSAYSSRGDAARSAFIGRRLSQDPDDVQVDLGDGRLSDLEGLLVEGGLEPFAFTTERAEWVFDGEHILSAAFGLEPNLALAEDHLDVVWSFHASLNTGGPWTAEVWETIGSTNGVYFYIGRLDEDGEQLKLGRLDEAIAIERGLALSGRTNEEREALLAEDDDHGGNWRDN